MVLVYGINKKLNFQCTAISTSYLKNKFPVAFLDKTSSIFFPLSRNDYTSPPHPAMNIKIAKKYPSVVFGFS